MSRERLIILVFLALAGSMINLVFVSFHETLDSGVLAISCIFISFLLAVLMYYLVFDDNDCNHKVHTLMSFGIFLMLSTIATKWIDSSYGSQDVSSVEFNIVGIESTYVKSTKFTYLKLQNQNGNIKYSIDGGEISSFKVGNKISLNATIGFFGYPTFE